MNEFDLEFRSLLQSKADGVVVQPAMPNEIARLITRRRSRYAVTAVAVVALLGAAALSASAMLGPKAEPKPPAGPAPSERSTRPQPKPGIDEAGILQSLAGTYETDVSGADIDGLIERLAPETYATVGSTWVRGHWTITIEPDGSATFSNPKFDDRIPQGDRLEPGRLFVTGGRTVGVSEVLYYDQPCTSAGRYRWTRSAKKLRFEVVSDECISRIAVMTANPWAES